MDEEQKPEQQQPQEEQSQPAPPQNQGGPSISPRLLRKAQSSKLGKKIREKAAGSRAFNTVNNLASKLTGLPSIPTNLKDLAKQGVQMAWSALPPPVKAIIIGVIILVLILIYVLVMILYRDSFDFDSSSTPPPSPAPVPGDGKLRIQKTGPATASNGENLTYSITVSYTGTQDVLISDPIPSQTSFVDASGEFTLETEASGRRVVRWVMKNTPSDVSTQESTTTQAVNFTTYTQAPYLLPAPNGPSDTTYSGEVLTRANEIGRYVAQYQPYLKTRVKNGDPKYIDPFLSVLWAVAIEGSWDNYSWNCNDGKNIERNDINYGCVGWFNSGDWQVGGIQVSQAVSHIVEDFKAAYGSTDPGTVQKVGQSVISKRNITNPSQFPARSLEDIVRLAGKPGTADQYRTTSDQEAENQQLIAILLMDPALNAIDLALEVAGDIQGRDNWRATMEGWESSSTPLADTYYRKNLQNLTFSNRGQALAQAYSGTAPGGNTNPVTTITRSFTVTVKPINNVIVENQAYAQELSGTGSIPGENTPANANTCNGHYTLNNPYNADGTGANFGDPNCTLTTPQDLDKLYAMLKQLDPVYADDWFANIIPCEAPGYNPNEYYRTGEAGDTPDAAGAWGLFQMGRGKNGPLDHGDVAWEQQTQNAIGYNNTLLNQNFKYWACAEYLWKGPY